MKYGYELQPAASNPVRNNVLRVGYDEFARPEQPAGTSHSGLTLEKVYRLENSLGN